MCLFPRVIWNIQFEKSAYFVLRNEDGEETLKWDNLTTQIGDSELRVNDEIRKHTFYVCIDEGQEEMIDVEVNLKSGGNYQLIYIDTEEQVLFNFFEILQEMKLKNCTMIFRARWHFCIK